MHILKQVQARHQLRIATLSLRHASRPDKSGFTMIVGIGYRHVLDTSRKL